MSALELAWNTWLFYSVIGFVFCLVTWKWAPVLSIIYVVGGVILVFTKFTDPSFFGVTEAEWKNNQYWKDVRLYLLIGQLSLSGLVIVIESFIGRRNE